MKKIQSLYILLCFLTLGNLQSNAQIQEGNLMVGVNIADINLGFQDNHTQFGFGINPKVGYFFDDNWALGSELKFGFNAAKNTHSIDYGIGAFSRYYLGDPRTVLLKYARFFLEADAGIAGRNFKVKNEPSISTNGLGLGFGVGLAYFISSHIGLESSLKYNGIVGFGTSPGSGNLNLNVGFQIYIPTSKAKQIYRDAESETKSRYSH